MADEYIRREDAKDALQEKVFHNLTDEFYGAMQAIDELPSADVSPVIHAHWTGVTPMVDTIMCSNCGWNYPTDEFVTPYCPSCGARMDEEVQV